MKNKKTPRANLENKRFIFFQIGIILTLLVTLSAFEWKSYDQRTFVIPMDYSVDVIQDDIPNTEIKKMPKLPAPKSHAIINIIEDDTKLEIDDSWLDEAFQETGNANPDEWNYELPEENIVENKIFIAVEDDPIFPGGARELFKFLGDNIEYPRIAAEIGVSGVVYLTFVVEKDGSITDIKIVRGIGGGCDEEAVRVVKMMPRWTPGKQRGKPVRVQFQLPVRFVLH